MSAIPTIPRTAKDCFEAINKYDMHGFLSLFYADAILIDEGKTYIGVKQISDWCKEALFAHKATVNAKQPYILPGSVVVVNLIMDGDFIADYGITEPFPLYFQFMLRDEKIKRLMITPWDSSRPSMNAAYLEKSNEKDPVSALKISPRPIKEPPQGWVQVKMQAAGLNYHDIFTMRGHSMHPMKFPLIIGCEGAGILEDGTEVVLFPLMGDANFKGDETLDPQRNVFSELTDGTLAEYVNVPIRNAIERPKALSAVNASVLGVAWLTAYRMLFTRSGLRAGQTMLVQGSSGGVTTALIQLGAAAGMRVWCTGRTVAKRELALRLGAEKVFSSGEELAEKADAVFDTSGEVTWAHSMSSVKTGGTIVTCGAHGGRTIPTDVGRLFVEQVNIRGSYLGNLQEFKDLISLVVAKDIKPHIGQVVPMQQANSGFQKMIDGETEGKIVVTMSNIIAPGF